MRITGSGSKAVLTGLSVDCAFRSPTRLVARLFMPRFHRYLSTLALAALSAASPALCAAAGLAATQSPSPAPAGAIGNATPAPLISLLLPLDAPAFAGVAAAVQSGCNAAFSQAGTRPQLEVVRTDGSASSIADGWAGAARRSSNIIIGPMTRSAVSALAASLLSRQSADSAPTAPVTLALNLPEEGLPQLPPRFYSFGLAVEQEARAIARSAWIEGLRNVIVVQGRGAIDRRTSQAFADEWMAYGGRIVDIRDFDTGADPASLEALRSQLAKSEADFIFLSADARHARSVRPYLGSQATVFSTSQVNDGRPEPGALVDLIGIRFVDMPWLLQPDHPAVMVYPRNPALGPDLQRFHALGIDACRIAALIASGSRRIDIDGVTGHLELNLEGTATPLARTVRREPIMASFRDSSVPPPAESPPTAGQ